MAVSKKPRHKRKPKGNIRALIFPEKDKKAIKALFVDVRIKCEMTLHTGMCNYQDVACFRDCLNLCSWMLCGERDHVEIDDETIEAFIKAHSAFHDLYERGNKAGGIDDESVRYVCRGEEIEAIKNGVEIAGDFIETMIELRPNRFLKLWVAMKKFLRGKGAGQLEFEGDFIADHIKKVCGV